MLAKNRNRKQSARTGIVVTATSAMVGLSVSSVLGQGAPSYRITDLGALASGSGTSEAYDISNQNHVVGWADQSVGGGTKQRSFLWMPKGSVPPGFPTDLTAGMNDLQVFAGANPTFATSRAHAIIRNGTEVRITGKSSSAAAPHGFFWEPIEFDLDPNERLIDIGDLDGGSGFSIGYGIDGSDPFYVVGESETDTVCANQVINLGFVWNSSSEIMTPLSTPADNLSIAYDIREESGITFIGGGFFECGNETCPSDLGDPVAWTALGSFVLRQPLLWGSRWGEARDVNDASNLVGWGTDPDCEGRPLFWNDTLAVGVVLETVPAGESGRALGLNSDKDVVGVDSAIPGTDAVIWESTGPGIWSYSDLEDLISSDCAAVWNLYEARAINDNGWIVGWGFHNSTRRAFLLRPIETCLHDLDGDGTVDTDDLLILFADYGPCPDAAETGEFCDSDFSCNGTVGTEDLTILFANWGPCP